jgi:hypothetical protein
MRKTMDDTAVGKANYAYPHGAGRDCRSCCMKKNTPRTDRQPAHVNPKFLTPTETGGSLFLWKR